MKRIAVITASALALGALVAPNATAATPAVTSGSLNWPIKESFSKYLGMDFTQGTIDASDGASTSGTDYVFPVDPKETSIDAAGTGTIATDGTLHFTGHPGKGPDGGLGLDITLSDVNVKVSGTTAQITADVAATGAAGREGGNAVKISEDDIVISTFTLSEALVPTAKKTYTTTDAATSLTAEGAAAFLNFYKPGELKDGNTDLTVTFGEGDSNSAPQPTPPAKGEGSSTAGIVGIVAVIVAILGAAGAAVSGLIPGFTLPGLK
ncbi:HtaA domain-containing protein [uncultured Corynebacterium sp.]|uniref:HtaA domain-containing protein n=1 Tax=uncultured Corynebacterium sp. TaxID=159447 RepID=UPI0025F70C51|nr:HtaA domain-containing protein [uncultured Corynebacterium sp.]